MSGSIDFVLVTPVLAWPPDQGSRRFQLEAARALSEIGRVTWITRTIGHQAEAERRLREEGLLLDLDRGFEARDAWSRLRRRVGIDWNARRRREPREIHFVSSRGVRDRVRAQARRHPEAWFVGAYWSTVRALEEAPRGRRVLLAADVESRAAERGLALGVSGIDADRTARLGRAERSAFAAVDHLLCLTAEDERDARTLLSTTSDRPTISRWPARIDVGEACPAPTDTSGDCEVVLTYGHWEADFNRDGLSWFLDEIWPQVHARQPRRRLRIVGRGTEPLRRAVQGVEWIGYVDDLRQEVAGCDAVAVPLRFAGGLRYRLIEALDYGRPVVCTPVAAAGAGASAGHTHLEAAEVGAWGEALRALDEPRRRLELIDVGRQWATDHYGTEASRTRLREVFANLGVSGGEDR